jgi:hypothetical protein
MDSTLRKRSTVILSPQDSPRDDYNYILGSKLAQGSQPPPYHERPGKAPFDVIVLCAAEWQPHLPQYSRVVHAPFRDHKPTDEDIRTAKVAAREVVRHITRRDRSVLVTCAMGWNRSGLVTGLALREFGFSPADIIQRIRKARGPNALSNRWFVELLKSPRF